MHDFEPEPQKRSRALAVWGVCAALLVGPAFLAWLVRGVGFAMQCAPGPGLCHGMALGGGLRDTLDLAWFVSTDTLAGVMVSFVAAVAALIGRRPLMAALTLLILPIAGLVLSTLAVFFSTYDGCEVNEAGVGACTLWGAKMGMAFHHAATAPWLIYDVVPYSFALALMVGIIGFLFFRERETPAPQHAMASTPRRRFDDQ